MEVKFKKFGDASAQCGKRRSRGRKKTVNGQNTSYGMMSRNGKRPSPPWPGGAGYKVPPGPLT